MSNIPDQQFNAPLVQRVEQGAGESREGASTKELIVVENSKLHEQCRHTSTLNHQLESALLGKDGKKEGEPEGSKLKPEIVGYFTDGLGPTETMHRLRQLGSEGAMAVQQAIQEGNLEKVMSIMDTINPAADRITDQDRIAMVDFNNQDVRNRATSKIIQDQDRRMQLGRQLKEMYGTNREFSPNEWAEKVEQLRRMLGADPVQKPESEMTPEERQEAIIREKIKDIPNTCADLRRDLLRIKPSMRRMILISDQAILDAKDPDWVRMNDARKRKPTPPSSSAVQVGGARFPTRRY